jgi:hypothetical protein
LSYEASKWIKSGHKGHLSTRNTFPKEAFPKSKYFSFDFGFTQETYGLEMNSRNLQIKGAKAIWLPQGWGPMLRLILATFPMEEIKERLFKSQERKLGQKYLQKSRKWKIFQHKIGDDLTQTHGCIDAN